MSLETGSHNVLRTSISTSADEGTSSFGPSISQSEYVPTDPVAAQNPGGTANGSAKRATKLKALSASYSSREQAPNESGDEQPLVEASSSSAGDLSDSNSDADADAAATAGDLLPDSRKVVQGLLRNIQPPKSRPSDTAVNRAKRNTVQISARGSVVDNDYQVSRASSQTRSALLRSASTRDYVETDSGQHPADELRQPLATSSDVLMRTTPSEPVIANNLLTQGLGHSASTLRPSSDTFAGEGNTSDAADNDSQERSVTAEAEGEEPLSPTSSSDTASIHHNEADDRGLVAAGSTAAAAAVAGGAAASVFSSAVLHRSLKDSSSRDSVLSRASIVSNSTSILNANRLSIVSLTNDELSLDDWLVILRGWNDMHDISATTTSFYQSFLKDMQGLGVTAPIQQTAAAAAAQSDAYDYIQRHVTELQLANSDTQAAIDDILGVSQGVGRRLDSLECELDDIARVLVHAN
ncbi:hypothetical protein LPJ66_009491 [Kickxella alabastrina]|uniref:Uncharacterized protein n=1 Tax=Kickxella alabastrina TaxID=61397 RepID=A0ACC1IB65_9FUNG|nr:hypothetical protein LPJ66_009491 [Kickxella alabastrina]